LCVISQYNHYCVFEGVSSAVAADSGRALRDEVVGYWHTVRDSVPMASYIVDVALLSTGKWCLIELNPYATTTGGCMYDWSRDNNVLHGGVPGSSPPQPDIRVREQVDEGLGEFVSSEVLPRMRDVRDMARGEKAFSEETGPWDSPAFAPASVQSVQPPGSKGCAIS
jgi:hypothetical protein